MHTFKILDDATGKPLEADTTDIRIMVDESKRGLVISCRRSDGEIAIYADDALILKPRSTNLAYISNFRDRA